MMMNKAGQVATARAEVASVMNTITRAKREFSERGQPTAAMAEAEIHAGRIMAEHGALILDLLAEASLRQAQRLVAGGIA